MRSDVKQRWRLAAPTPPAASRPPSPSRGTGTRAVNAHASACRGYALHRLRRPAVLDVERGRLQSPSASRVTKPGRPLMKPRRTSSEEPWLRNSAARCPVHFHNMVEAEDRPHGSGPFASAVGVEADIGCQHRGERRHVAAP